MWDRIDRQVDRHSLYVEEPQHFVLWVLKMDPMSHILTWGKQHILPGLLLPCIEVYGFVFEFLHYLTFCLKPIV